MLGWLSGRSRTLPLLPVALSLTLVGCRDSTGPDEAQVCHPLNPTTTIRESLEDRPFGLAISRAGLLYVGQVDGARLARTVLPATSFTGTVSVGDGPVRIIFAPAGATAYVANQYVQTVGVVDVTTSAQVATMSVQGSPISLAVSRDGSRVYAGTGAGRIAVIDAAVRSVLLHIVLEGEINGLVLHPTEALLYASGRTRGRVWEINTTTNEVVRTFEAGGIPQELAVSQDGRELYLADENGPVQVWDLGSATRTATVPEATVGFGLALSPDQAHMYVSSSLLGRVYVIERASRTILTTIETEGIPRRIAFAVTDCTAAIANEAGWVDFVR
jgi:YVTN family beta-propeller protein